jgi:hypothetical protein
MSSRMRWPVSPLLVVALVAGIGVLLVGESFFHTDDGCPVETHCLTCKWAAGSIAVVTPDLTQALALEPLGAVVALPAIAASQAPTRSPASRGPPRA